MSRRVVNKTSRRRGFTLIEIVIAVTIFSVIMLGIMRCWKVIINGTQTGQAAAAAAQRARTSMRAIEDSLSNAEVSKQNVRFLSFLADTEKGRFAKLSFSARLPSTFLFAGYFGDNVLRRVIFEVQKGADDHANLVMTQYPILAVIDDQNPPKSIVLAKDVSMFQLDFWSPKDNDWMTEFLPSNEVPPMIRVTLGVGHAANDATVPYDVISRVIAMPVKAH